MTKWRRGELSEENWWSWWWGEHLWHTQLLCAEHFENHDHHHEPWGPWPSEWLSLSSRVPLFFFFSWRCPSRNPTISSWVDDLSSFLSPQKTKSPREEWTLREKEEEKRRRHIKMWNKFFSLMFILPSLLSLGTYIHASCRMMMRGQKILSHTSGENQQQQDQHQNQQQ